MSRTLSKIEYNKRKTLQIKVRESKTDDLRNYVVSLSKNRRKSLNYKYGRILYHLSVLVQKESLTALAQFFDPTLRCFQFQDFQLAPAPEEFKKILETLKPTKGPFKMIWYHPTVEEMAYHLNIHDNDLQVNLRICGDFKSGRVLSPEQPLKENTPGSSKGKEVVGSGEGPSKKGVPQEEAEELLKLKNTPGSSKGKVTFL
ncbi:hypothetical protein KIW84_010207 [Lathyrus oleraceus]|uniref:DUF7745 domain-containing protein n=1 Tax=Pisum sativum TaxID=3888 RepID=A0A9D4YJE8_PEA|nr:hypothetical protein KIW84_010207 [Pisum sativum]